MNKLITILCINLIIFNNIFLEPVPLYPNTNKNNQNASQEVQEWNIKQEFPKITVRHYKKEKPGVIRILSYDWNVKSKEHEGNYNKEIATIYDTAKRNKPFKVKPNDELLIEGTEKPKSVKVELLEGEFQKISCKKDKIIIPNKVGKFPIKVTMEFENGYITYGLLIQIQR